jgi:hypothetical protein
LTNVVLSDTLPAGVCCPVDLPGSDVPLTYDEQSRIATWQIGTIATGETATIGVSLHSLSSVPSGTVISNTFTLLVDELDQPIVAEGGLTADSSICAATPTPTATPSPTPTLTPTPEPPIAFGVLTE